MQKKVTLAPTSELTMKRNQPSDICFRLGICSSGELVMYLQLGQEAGIGGEDIQTILLFGSITIAGNFYG